MLQTQQESCLCQDTVLAHGEDFYRLLPGTSSQLDHVNVVLDSRWSWSSEYCTAWELQHCVAGRQSEREREIGTHGKPDFVYCLDIYITIGHCQATHSLMSGTKASEVLVGFCEQRVCIAEISVNYMVSVNRHCCAYWAN
jgi:hypothetical protein